YKVQQSSDGGKTWKTVKLVKGSEELKIRGLKRNTSYKYRALAYKSNGGGTNALGAWSGVKTVRTKK
ncbi:fibronectin type III domain-containing protein, partial [Hominimerdicola sp. 21CYCFAH17_S]